MIGPDDVMAFWFDELGEDAWFKKSDDVDRTIAMRFGDLYRSALAGEMDDWQATAAGSVALVIVLDQFGRNMFRGRPEAFGGDALALQIAKAAIERGFEGEMSAGERYFLYMPFMHSESLADQDRCVACFEALGDGVKYAQGHRDIVARFGRFPHRNDVLGRESSDEERQFLTQPGSSY